MSCSGNICLGRGAPVGALIGLTSVTVGVMGCGILSLSIITFTTPLELPTIVGDGLS